MKYINCIAKSCELKPSTGFMFEARSKCAGCESAMIHDPASSWRWIPYKGETTK